MKTVRLTSILSSAALTLGLLATASSAWAVETFTATTGAEKSTAGKKPRSGQAAKPASDKGSSESKTERDKRLQRECRGRPNAGACEGYAS